MKPNSEQNFCFEVLSMRNTHSFSRLEGVATLTTIMSMGSKRLYENGADKEEVQKESDGVLKYSAKYEGRTTSLQLSVI